MKRLVAAATAAATTALSLSLEKGASSRALSFSSLASLLLELSAGVREREGSSGRERRRASRLSPLRRRVREQERERWSFSPFFLFAPPSVSEAEPLSTTFVGEASLFGRIPTLSLSLSRTHATNVSCELARSLSARKRNPLTLMATLQAALGASRVVGSFVGGATAAPRVVAATPLGRRTPTTTTNAAAASASSSSFQRPLETRPTPPEHGGRQLEGGVAASSSRVRRRTRRGGRSTGRNDGTASASPPAPSFEQTSSSAAASAVLDESAGSISGSASEEASSSPSAELTAPEGERVALVNWLVPRKRLMSRETRLKREREERQNAASARRRRRRLARQREKKLILISLFLSFSSSTPPPKK